jgi:hypothetical protein
MRPRSCCTSRQVVRGVFLDRAGGIRLDDMDVTRAGRTRWLLAALSVVAFLLVAVATADAAEGGGANNVVLSQTTADYAFLPRSAVQVTQLGGDTVANQNLASAIATDCIGCRSTAVAVQAVLVTGDPSTVVPVNAAVAVNGGCTSCVSYAYAFQYVLTTGRPVYLSPTAQQELTGLRAQVQSVAASDLSPDEETAQLDALTARFKAIIDSQVVAAGQSPAGAASRRIDATPVP